MDVLDDINQVVARIEKGLTESQCPNVELKSVWRLEHGERISALANKTAYKKTWLIVGINDDGTLCGRDAQWVKGQEEIISQQLNQFLNPSQAVEKIECHEVNNSWVIIIQIIQPGVVTQWKRVAYKALGTTSSEMTAEETMELTLNLPGAHDFSAKEWEGEYDATLVQKFAKVVSQKRGETTFINLDQLEPEEILRRLRIKGRNVTRILFGDVAFRLVFYNADEEPIENLEGKGLCNILLGDFIDFAKTRNPLLSKSAYPQKALKEALANAVAHSAFFEKNGDIVIEVFQEKLILSNLCVPEASVFANKWFSRSRNTVNNLLMETLRLAGYVDELGRGKNVIYSETIKAGEKPPVVNVEKAGRCNRWRLYLYGGAKNEVQIKLFNRLKGLYKDEHMALIANAMILWRNKPVSEIKQFIDGESLPLFRQILEDINGPIFYYQPEDKITLHRWARVLLEEGQDAKAFTLPEEEGLRTFAYDICTKYHQGIITTNELRKLAHMGQTNSEKNLSSKLLTKWKKQGHLEPLRRGVYKFKQPEPPMWEKFLSQIEIVDGIDIAPIGDSNIVDITEFPAQDL